MALRRLFSMDNYWEKLTASRVTRRRAMIATSAGAMGAAFLAACGGSDSGSSGSSGGGDKGGSSAVNKPEDTLKEAKRGGTIKDRTFGDVSTQDPFTPNNTLNAIEGQVYSSLVKFKPGYLKLPS